MSFDYHKDSCRAIQFSPDGDVIYTGSKDKSLAVITNGILAMRIEEAHPCPIFTICHIENGNIVATGDDDGMIRIWDLRVASEGKKHSVCMEFKEHEGTISKIVYNQ